jgi:hypothetical protein
MMWRRIGDDINQQAYILWLVRNGRVNNWTSLAHEFGFDPTMIETREFMLLQHLDRLQDAGLVVLEDWAEETYEPRTPGRIRLSERWPKIQAALDTGACRVITH